jgi:hypothetical protein
VARSLLPMPGLRVAPVLVLVLVPVLGLPVPAPEPRLSWLLMAALTCE